VRAQQRPGVRPRDKALHGRKRLELGWHRWRVHSPGPAHSEMPTPNGSITSALAPCIFMDSIRLIKGRAVGLAVA